MTRGKRIGLGLFAGIAAALVSPFGFAQERVTITSDDGANIVADLYRGGRRAVILAHGGRYTRDSWKLQAELLSRLGYRVLAPDFRGFGESTGPPSKDRMSAPLHLDLLASARYLRSQGVEWIAIVGGSLGGMAAGDAVIHGRPGEIDRVVFLGSTASLAGGDLGKLGGRKLFVIARDDLNGQGKPRLVGIQADYEKVPPPRELLVVDGSAHAQAIFDGEEAPRVFDRILRFLAEE
jgi:pimeloyl-ACP methyl ester carboxylesterase